jgi:hypothetical protein
MEIKERLYPYPVLSWYSDDYIDTIFQPSFEITGNKKFYKIILTYKTSSKSINNLIKEKKAVYALHLECTSTRFRSIYKFDDDTYEIDIPVGDLDDKVQATRVIIADDEIINYSSPEFHEDFSGRSFNLNKGDIIAVGSPLTFFADKKDDELAKLPSIFSIKKNPDEAAPSIDIKIFNEKIIVYLNSNVHDKFSILNLDQLLRTTLISSIYVPALIYTLEKLTKIMNHEDYEEFRWYRVLAKRLKELNFDITKLDSENSVVVANALIDDPLSNSLNDLKEILLRNQSQEDN